MKISKVWQWIQDKKTNTIRKWRSSFIGGGTASTFEGGERFFVSELEIPESTLKPIGGSFNDLPRPQSDKMARKKGYKKRRASEKYFGLTEPLIVKDDWDQDNLSDDPSQIIEAHESYQNFDLLYDNYPSLEDFNEAGPSYMNHSTDVYDDFDDEIILKTSTPKKKMSRVSSPPTMIAKDNGRKISESSATESETGYEKNKKKLRFNIPQVSLSSAEDPTVATLLLAVEELRDQLKKPDYFLTTSQKKYSSSSEEDHPMSETESTTALTIGMSPSTPPPTTTTPTNTSSAPTSPHSILQTMKTVDFIENDEKEQEIFIPRRVVTDVDRRRQSLAQRKQSNVQLVQSVSGRRTSTTLIPLTMAQIHLVRSLWRQIYVSKGPTVIGQTIIHKLFFKLPITKDQFRKCPIPKNFPNHDSFAKAHSKAMAEMIDSVVEQLDNLEAVSGQLERVGKCHARIMRGELSSKLWNSVAETFIDCTLEWGDKRCRSETVRKAWALIVAFIVERIKIGHLEERKHMLAMRSTISSMQRIELKNTIQHSEVNNSLQTSIE